MRMSLGRCVQHRLSNKNDDVALVEQRLVPGKKAVHNRASGVKKRLLTESHIVFFCARKSVPNENLFQFCFIWFQSVPVIRNCQFSRIYNFILSKYVKLVLSLARALGYYFIYKVIILFTFRPTLFLKRFKKFEHNIVPHSSRLKINSAPKINSTIKTL